MSTTATLAPHPLTPSASRARQGLAWFAAVLVPL
jgi:hypothetical protein